MRMPSGLPVSRRHRIAAVALLCLAPLAQAQASETITATASVKTSGGAVATAPLSVAVDRFSTDTERDELLAALKEDGTDGVSRLLLTRPPIGTLTIGNQFTAIKYIYARTVGDGRLITAVTGSPIAFIGAAAPGAKPRGGVDLGLVFLEGLAGGPRPGWLCPATRQPLNEEGATFSQG